MSDFDRYDDQLEDQIRAGEITRAEANTTLATMTGAKLGGILGLVALCALCPAAGTALLVASYAGGAAVGAKLGKDIASS